MPATALAGAVAGPTHAVSMRTPPRHTLAGRRVPPPPFTRPPRPPHAPLQAVPRSLSGGDLAESPTAPAFPPDLLEEYAVEGMLGAGSYGTVVAARRRVTSGGEASSPGTSCAPARVAVKVLSKAPALSSAAPAPDPSRLGGVPVAASALQDRVSDRIAEEVAILRALQPVPEAVQLLDVFESPAAVFLVTEAAAGGDLDAALRVSPSGALPPPAVAAIAHDALQVLAACHAAGITYGDFKPANILLASPLASPWPKNEGGDDAGAGVAARLADFGCATRAAAPRVTGTPLFLPPEALLLGKAGPAVDIYSLGAVLYLALTGRPPLPAPPRSGDGAWAVEAAVVGPPSYTALSPSDLVAAALRGDGPLLDGHPVLDSDPAAAAFLGRLLHSDWEARPTAADALADPWLAGVRAARAGPRAAAAAARAKSSG